MSNADEFKRFAALYAGMSNEELVIVAQEQTSLTDDARRAILAEMERRGLTLPPARTEEGHEGVEFRDLLTIRKFRDLPEALLAKGGLESAGIECYLTDDNMVRLDWFISNLLGGVKLNVKPEDAASAIEILDQPIPEGFEAEGTGSYQQPRCPVCQSLDVTFEELNKPVAYTSAYIGLPLPLHYGAWRCHACKHEWKDAESVEREAEPNG